MTLAPPHAPTPQTLTYETPAPYSATASVWAMGDLVCANDCAVFPPRCIACNGNDRLRTKGYNLRWAPAWALSVLILGLLPGLLLLMLLQKDAKLRMSTCIHCRRKVTVHQLITLAMVLAAFAGFWAGAVVNSGFSVAALVILFAAIIYGITATRLFTIKRIKAEVITLKGLHKDFITSLN